MQHNNRWMVVGLIVAGLQLSACAQTPASTTSKAEPAHVEAIDGTDLNRVVLTAEAAKRLAIETVPVRQEQVTRKWTVGGEVMAAPTTRVRGETDGSTFAREVWVRVPLSADDVNKVDRSQPASILPLARTKDATGMRARLVASPAHEVAQGAAQALHYAIEGRAQGLTSGQRVRVELALAGSGTQRTVIPYGSVIYDLKGDTWIYTSPEPLTFIRERVTVDYIDGDRAVVSQAPPVGTEIVSVGAAELYGTEFGVGH